VNILGHGKTGERIFERDGGSFWDIGRQGRRLLRETGHFWGHGKTGERHLGEPGEHFLRDNTSERDTCKE